MRIPDGQMAALEHASVGVYVTKCARLLREVYPEETGGITDEALRAELAPIIDAARGYGLLTEQQIFVYVRTARSVGKDFDQMSPTAQEVLLSTYLDADEKALWLHRWTLAMLPEGGAE